MPSLWSASENLCYGKHGGKCLNLKKHYVKHGWAHTVPISKNNKTMSKMNENVWQTILKIVIAVASAILGGLGAAAARLMN